MRSGVGPELAGGSGVPGGGLAGGSGVTPVAPPSADISFLGIAGPTSFSSHSSLDVPMVACDVGGLRMVQIAGNGNSFGGTTVHATGWTLVNKSPEYGGDFVTGYRCYTLARFKRVGDTDDPVTFTIDAAFNTGAVCFAYSNVASYGTPAHTDNGSGAATVTPSAITTTADGSWVAYLADDFRAGFSGSQAGYVVDGSFDNAPPNGGHQALHIAAPSAGVVTGGTIAMPASNIGGVLAVELVAGTFVP